MNEKLYIQKIIRDDGKILEFDAEEIYLAKSNNLLIRPDPDTTSVQYTEEDGGEMLAQRHSTYDQTINGLIVPHTADYWTLTARLWNFFVAGHLYKIIYKRRDGTLFKTGGAWISTGLQVTPRPYEDYAEWTVALTVGGVGLEEYSEDTEGKEVFANTVKLSLITMASGGEEWDSVGQKWDSAGEMWSGGTGGIQNVNISSARKVYPVWIVEGPSINPTLQNNNTDTVAAFDGTIAEGQTLKVDFSDGTAYLDTALVSNKLSGIVYLDPGDNMMGFNSDGGATTTCAVSWNNNIV